MSMQYFRCKTGGKHAPLLELTPAEARDMKNHPDYERVNEFGEVIPVEEEPQSIPFAGAQGRR